MTNLVVSFSHDDDITFLKWRLRCLCRQAGPGSTGACVALLRQLPGGLCPETQIWFTHGIIDEPLAALFSRDTKIERNLIKAVFLAAEADGHEICEELSTALQRRLTSNAAEPTKEGGWSYKIYTYSMESLDIKTVCEKISEVESRVLRNAEGSAAGDTDWGNREAGVVPLYLNQNMLAGNTGCHEWEAGFYLAEYVLSHAQQFHRASVLELGCGVGVVGVALARVRVRAALCTDGDEEALENCRRNLKLNGALRSTTPQRIQVQRLRWEDEWSPTMSNVVQPDIVLGSDLLYDPETIPALLKVIKDVLGQRQMSSGCEQAYALIATTKRNEKTLAKFISSVREDPRLEIEDMTWKFASSTNKNTVRFWNVVALDSSRERILLHKLTFQGS